MLYFVLTKNIITFVLYNRLFTGNIYGKRQDCLRLRQLWARIGKMDWQMPAMWGMEHFQGT